MKKVLFILILSLFLGLTGQSFAEDEIGYDHLVTYPGLFKTDRLYMLSESRGIWLGSYQPKYLQELKCDEIVNALRYQGTWTGNLSRNGECLGYEEAPSWSSGNYLNYLTRLKRKLGTAQ